MDFWGLPLWRWRLNDSQGSFFRKVRSQSDAKWRLIICANGCHTFCLTFQSKYTMRPHASDGVEARKLTPTNEIFDHFTRICFIYTQIRGKLRDFKYEQLDWLVHRQVTRAIFVLLEFARGAPVNTLCYCVKNSNSRANVSINSA